MLMLSKSQRTVIYLVASLSCFEVQRAHAATVKFSNPTGQTFQLHVKNGSIGQNPDSRGHQNTTMKPGDTFDDPVGDGDTWYAYGNKQINDDDNPPLCNAAGGTSVNLDKSQQCYANN